MRRALLLVFLIGCLSFTYAQDSLKHKRSFHYFNVFQSGVLIGKKGYGTTAGFSTIHGIRHNNFAVGIGFGYDDYTRSIVQDYYTTQYAVHWKAIPVFLSLSMDFWKIRNSDVFLQLNSGHSMIYAGKNSQWLRPSYEDGGMLINPMLGYRIRSGKHSLYFGAGYQWQKNRYGFEGWIWGSPSASVSVEETMQRFDVQIGFGWH